MEENGKKISQRTGGSLVDIAKSKGSQQTQGNSGLTAEQQNLKDWTKNKLQEQGILPGINQGTQTATTTTTTTTLPGITKLQNLQESNKIQFGSNVKSNIILPGISEPKYPNATLSQATQETEKEGNKRAKDNVKDTRSMNEEIHDEMVKGEYIPLLKQGVIQTWNDVKKVAYRKGVEAIENFANHPYETFLGSSPVLKTLGTELDKKRLEDPNVKAQVDKGISTMWKSYYRYEDKINNNFEKRVDRNMNKIIAKEYQDSGGIFESIKKGDTNMIKYGLVQGFSTSVIPMIPGIIAGIVTKNPTVTASIAFASTAPIEDQEAYEEAIKEGATRDEAEVIGKYAGIINGALETAGEFLQLKGLLKPLKKNISKEITKKTTRQIIGRGLWEWSKGVGGESLTEGTQELVTNALIKTINENKDIFEGVLDSMIVGGVLGGGGSTLGAGGAMIEERENNKKIDLATDIEALNYVMESEKRKQQQDKIKQKILNRRGARSWEEVETRDTQIENTPEMDNGYTPTPEEAEQWKKEDEERRQYEQELEDEYNRESQIEQDMINDVLDEGDLNEDLGDPRYQKSDSPQSVSKDTVSEKSHAGNITITPENSSEINQNLNGIKRNVRSLNPETFLQKLKNSFTGAEGSNYIKVKINGKNYVMRISNHHTNANTSLRHPQRNTSIVIKLMKKGDDGKTIKFKKNNKVNLAEFVYDPANLDSDKMRGIVDGIQNWMQTGEYTDTNYDSKNESTRKKGDNKKSNESETGEKHQLKYEDKDYTPGVANKNEKNISGKEGIKQKNTINDQTIEELAKKYGVKVEVIKGMIEILRKGKLDGYAYGKYKNQLLTLSEQIKESTAPHELLHAIFDMIDPETKTYLIAQVMKSEGWNAETAEERLADSFSNFFRTGKIEGAPKSTWGRIKMFFKRVRSFINGMNKWRNELEEIFTDIITADGIVDLQSKIDESSRLNKSKERMRKRFMEYRKNAIKTQEKAESENKYQKTGKNEENEYTPNGQRSSSGSAGKISTWNTPFSFNTKTIQYNGKEITHTYDPKNSFLTDYTFSVPKELQQYVDLFNRAIENGYESAIIGEFDGKYIKIYFNKNFADHFEKHGGFAPENLIMTLNRFDAFAQKVVNGKRRFVFEKQLPNGNWLIAITSIDLTEISFYESDNSKIGGGFIEKYQSAGDINSPAFKKRFDGSKVVNEDGSPKIMYHGTPNKGFTVFKEGYFTENKEYADKYQNPNASSIRFNKKADNPGTYAVYLSIKNPFDTRDPKAKKIFEEEYFGNYGMGTPLGEKGLPDWMDGNDLQEFIMENHPEYDGLILDEGGVFIPNTSSYENDFYGGEVRERGVSYVPFRANQIKSATDNVGTYDVNNDDIRYQKMDDEYAEAVENGNTTRAKAILREYAKEKGYNSSTDYQGSLAFNGSAPASDGLTKEERVSGNEDIYSQTLGDFASDGLDGWDLGRQLDPNGGLGVARARASRKLSGAEYDLESINNLRNAVMEYKKGNKDVKIRMYRAIDSDIKEEKFRNGDWITPSKEYAKHHIDLQDWKKGRVISEDVSIEDIRWDGNDINERGFDNEKEYGYKDTPNNRKELEITYDDNGNLIPLSERFNENVEDERYQRVYHGTKADFDKFDSSHMGQGEGGQAHGWGHYVAVDKKTGKRYADKQGGILFKGKKRGELPNNMKGTAMYKIMGDIMDGKDKAEAIKDESEYMLTNYLNTLDETYKNTYDYLQTVKPEDFEWNGYLYEVEIPDPVKADTPTGSNYLDEDYTLNDGEAKKMIKELKDWNYEAGKRLEKSYYEENGKSLYLKIENLLGSDKDASEFLNFIGYDGIHYDGRDDGECYVIFNDNALEIKNHERYQKAGDINSPAFKKRFGDSKVVDGNGNPKIVYHGTRNGGFTSFNKNDSGIRFSEDIDVADSYAGDDNRWTRAEIIEGDKLKDDFNYEGDEGIYKVYLSIKNPLVLDYEGYGATNHPELSAPSYYLENLSDEYDGVIAKNIRDEGGWNGGVNDPEERYAENTVYGVKNPNQIKSATDNVGTYDANNDDIRYQRVYHGSIADFDRFDNTHMGEGEGTQARGYGFYVAFDKDVAKGYAEWIYHNKKFPEEYRLVKNKMDGGMSFDEARNEVMEEIQSDIEEISDSGYKDHLKRQIESLKNMKEDDLNNINRKRNLYEIEIPDEIRTKTPTGKNYLDYDKKITLAQYEKMKKALREYGDFTDNYQYNLDYRQRDYAWGGRGGSLYDWISVILGGDKEASEFLNSIGYDGIKYDGGGDGNSAVIINDEALDIVNHEKYQKAGDINSPAFKKRFGDSKIVDENGNPLVVYHGTPVKEQINIFDKNRAGRNTSADFKGIFFTDELGVADIFSHKQLPGSSSFWVKLGEKGRVYATYLKMDKPLDLNDITKEKAEELYNYRKITPQYGGGVVDLYKGENGKKKFIDEAMDGHPQNTKYMLDMDKVEEAGYDGYIAKMYGGDKPGNEYVVWESNQVKSATDNVGTYDPNNDDIRYQITEYDYDENGNRKWIKFGDNSEFDPSIFGTPTKEEQIEEDKENEKSNPFYNAWMKYNNQNYKDDQLTLGEFVDAVGAWGDKKQEEFNEKQNDILEVENDPKMLELQLRAVKLMEEEGNVGKKFGKNVSKEVRDRQQAEVEKKREDLAKDIYEWMYPGLSFEESTYEDQSSAWDKEAEWEMLGKDKIEEKLKYFKKDKNGNWEKKNIKLETPQEQREKIEKSGNFDEIIEPKDRVIQWETPEGQKGRLDKAKDPRQFKKVMEKINSGKSKTKVELKDVTNEVRALERYKENEKAEKERRKKEKQEEYAKKKQEEYKRNVRLKAFQRLVDMQRFEKFTFLTEDEIKQRWGFTDEEWKKITEQLDLGYPPKKRNEKAVSDFNKAVDSEVKFIIEGLTRQNNMKRKDAEKNLGEIGEIDLDVLLGKDEEKGQKEVEEFERIAEEEKKKSKKEKNKRLEQAREDVTQVEIDKERENSKSEKERVDKIIKSTKTDNTVWGSIKKTASDILTPVSTRIREISPKIYRELMRYFQNKDILTNQRLKEIDPFLKAMGKIRKENPVRFMDIWVALANRNIGYANGLLQEYGVKVPTKLLDTIFDEAEDVGLNINYLGSYYPLSVKAPKSFLEELMKVGNGDIASEIEKKIQQESQKKGGPLDESEITAIINSVIAGEEKGPDVNLGNKHLKKRNTEIERTPKMLEYCDDPISTLITYIEGMTDKIERAKFLGKSRSGNVHTIADYVYNAKNGLTAEQQDELMELLKSVFNDASPNKFYQTWRDIATLTTLGSPSSTLTQIGDLSFSIYENGWREALKAVWDIFMKRKAFDLKDMGVINRGEEYTNINSQKNLLQKAIHNVFKLTFFSNFDTFGKSTFIQSTWNKRRKRALKGENGDPQLIKDIMKITDDEYTTMKIINDLRNGVFSEDVALVMYMKLGNIQPLTKAQMPKAYLDNPNNGRLFYQFKTFGIKQLDYVLQETKQQTKGFKNLSTTEKFLRVAQIASMIFIMTLMGAGASELKDITMRRRSNSLILRWLFGEEVGSDQIWDKIGDSALQLFGLSRYTVMQMKSDPVDAITSLFTTFPATNLVTYPFKDIVKAFKNDGSINWRNPSSYQLIPVIGKYRYWIYGGGQDKQQEALDKEKKTTTSGGSSRSTRTTRNTRNSRSRRNTR